MDKFPTHILVHLLREGGVPAVVCTVIAGMATWPTRSNVLDANSTWGSALASGQTFQQAVALFTIAVFVAALVGCAINAAIRKDR